MDDSLWFLENTSTFKQKEIDKHIFPQYQSPKWDQKDRQLHVTFYYTDAPFVVGQDTTYLFGWGTPL